MGATHMFPFARSVRKADQVRRYVIQSTASGWEVREERGTEIVRQSCYQDWHRVERARRAFAIKLSELRENGWQDVDPYSTNL
ncbi:MAG: hypothetical protein ACRD2A_09165 [Vicinamibacterales bacterium]